MELTDADSCQLRNDFSVTHHGEFWSPWRLLCSTYRLFQWELRRVNVKMIGHIRLD